MMKKSSANILIGIGSFLLFSLLFAAISFRIVYTSESDNEPNRQALLNIYDCINVGARREEVLACYHRYRTPSIRLLGDFGNEWKIQIPLEFGASDWCIRIDFQNDRVSSASVRTSDGPKPKNAPPDKSHPTRQ
jgi:hypothetical protein